MTRTFVAFAAALLASAAALSAAADEPAPARTASEAAAAARSQGAAPAPAAAAAPAAAPLLAPAASAPAAPAPAASAPAAPAPAASAPAASAPAGARPGAVVVFVADGGGLDLDTVRALRAIATDELRKQGLSVAEDPRFEGVHPAGPATDALVASTGGRVFSVRVAGRLGSKVPLTLEELGASGAVLASSSLTAGSIEECDVVIPRLVEAVLAHKAVGDTARLATVTSVESRPFQKKPGERFFTLGLPVPLFAGDGSSAMIGFSFGYHYEAEHFLLGVAVESAENKGTTVGGFTVDGAWLPLDGDVTPYLGGGIGYLGANGQNGMGAKLMAGVEAFRLHSVRLLAGVDAFVPFFDTGRDSWDWVPNPDGSGTSVQRHDKGSPIYFTAHIRLAF